jgi:hypothetical protein
VVNLTDARVTVLLNAQKKLDGALGLKADALLHDWSTLAVLASV